jgi:hypothetical protein
MRSEGSSCRGARASVDAEAADGAGGLLLPSEKAAPSRKWPATRCSLLMDETMLIDRQPPHPQCQAEQQQQS